MKVAVISYHKNADQIYKQRWIDKSVNSILNQVCYFPFEVFEANYGNEPIFYYPTKSEHVIHHIMEVHKDHVSIMNRLINLVFASGFDVVANTNQDDFYSPNRLEIQLKHICSGYDLVSSNFHYVAEQDDKDEIIQHLRMSDYNIQEQLNKNHNVIAHPCVMMTKQFWAKHGPYSDNEIPVEDMNLWRKAINNGAKMFITPEFLLFYRRHGAQICR